MIRKVLIVTGLGVIGFAFYKYFKTQVDLALSYDYKIKDFTLVGIDGDDVNVKVIIEITNKSNFQVVINSFDLDLFYNNVQFASVVSNDIVTIQPNTSFKIDAFGTIKKSSIKESLPTFVANVVARKPIDVVVDGVMKLKLMNINSTVRFDKQKVNYSADFAQDWGFSDTLENLKSKYPKVFGIFEKK